MSQTPIEAAPDAARRPPRLAYVVTEDWFFVSHFLPMARAARQAGFDVAVIARVRDHRAVLEAEDLRVIPLEAERQSLNPLAVVSAVRRLAAILQAEHPDIVHCIALRAILVGGAAARLAGIGRRVYAVTGLGFLAARTDAVAAAARAVIARIVRGPLESAGTRYLFENPDDPLIFGLRPEARRVTIVGGAGIDPQALSPAPLPPPAPLRLAFLGRMLWSKGVDVAVEAVGAARALGADVTLTLVGAPDASNPKAVPEATLRAWAERPGIAWPGPTRDVAGVWAAHHAAIMPSRGGEGLPRAILEAAACGRAVLTTDVPGCRTFVRDGQEGFVTARDDVPALAARIAALAADPARVAAMGQAARARVLDGHTEEAVMGAVTGLYRDMLLRHG